MPSSKKSTREALPSLGQRLLWITVFRTIATTLVLVVLSTRLLSQGPEALSADDTLSFSLIGFVYVLSIAYALPLRQGQAKPWLAYVQIGGDIGLAALLMTRTGGLESPFTFVFLLAVLAGAILLGRRGAIFACALGSSVLVLRTVLLQTGWAPPWLGPDVQPFQRMVFPLFSSLLGLFLIAWLASYLSEQLLRTGGRLVEREADLSALANLQREILNCMPSGLITCRRDGVVTYMNRAAGQILGISPDAPGLQLESLIPGVLAIPLSSRRNELPAETAHGQRVLGLTLAPLEGTELLIVFQDLTALRKAEDELRRADHLAALGKLSAQLAHEIRNPLASMRGSAQLLAADSPSDGPLGRLAGILIRESDRLSALVEDFLRFARPLPPQRRQTAVHALVSDVIEMMRCDPLARQITFLEELESSWCPVDSDQLQQVLLNLLRNACSAVGPGGTVKVEVHPGPGGGTRLRVWDSGGGIPPEDVPRLFEPFFSKRPGGTGLGLSTVHSIVRAHGGTIDASSSAAAGTEFVVVLPTVAHEGTP